jgi:hypothetical protein
MPKKYDSFKVDVVIKTSKAYTEEELGNMLKDIWVGYKDKFEVKGSLIGMNRKTNTRLKNDR